MNRQFIFIDSPLIVVATVVEMNVSFSYGCDRVDIFRCTSLKRKSCW